MKNTLLFLILITFSQSKADSRAIWDNTPIPPRSGVVEFDYSSSNIIGPARDRVGTNLMVSDDPEHHHQNEAWMFVNPANSDHIIGGCNDYRGGDATCGWFVSFDGGESWDDGVIEGLDEFERAGDPSVVLNRDGVAWFSGIHYTRDSDDGGIFCSRSDDGGSTWEEPVWVVVHRDEFNAPFEDKPFLAIDNTGGENDGCLYIVWVRFGTGQIYFSKSSDGGDEWTQPLRLYAGRGHGPLPSVGINGELYIIWKDYSRDRMVGVKSEDAGDNFGELLIIAETDALPRVLAPTNFRVNSLPTVAIDHSEEENSGRIYVAWADHRSGDADIMLSWSDDEAENWTEPERVNNDETENGLDQFFPWFCVDPSDGVLYGMWYDRRRDEENIFLDLYGCRWSDFDNDNDNFRISSVSFDPRIGFEGQFIGDYNGIAALDGRAFPGWCDSRNENQDIFVAQINNESHFQLAEGNQDHRFIVNSIMINDDEPEINDELAVLDSDDNVVGVIKIDQDIERELVVTGDWVRVRSNQFQHWSIWDDSEQEEIDAVAVPVGGDRTLTHDGRSVVEIVAPPPHSIEIALNESWNLISIPFYTVSLDPWVLFNPIRDNIFLVRDESGKFLTYDWNYSNMLAFNPFEGYYVKTNSADTLTIAGFRLDSQTPVPIDPGWNIISYLPDYTLDPWMAFDTIIDELIIAKDINGRFLLPEHGYSNMGLLLPGQGYQVKIAADQMIELVYPEEDEDQVYVAQVNKPVYFPPPDWADANMSVLISDFVISGNTNLAGTITASLTEGKICGKVSTETSPPWGMAVWGNSNQFNIDVKHNSVEDLAQEITFTFQESNSGDSYQLKSENHQGGIYFKQDDIVLASLSQVEAVSDHPFSSFKVSPNPVNSTAALSISMRKTTPVELDIYDLKGRLISRIYSGDLSTGTHYFSLGTDNLSSGLYFIELRHNEFSSRQNFVVIK